MNEIARLLRSVDVGVKECDEVKGADGTMAERSLRIVSTSEPRGMSAIRAVVVWRSLRCGNKRAPMLKPAWTTQG